MVVARFEAVPSVPGIPLVPACLVGAPSNFRTHENNSLLFPELIDKLVEISVASVK